MAFVLFFGNQAIWLSTKYGRVRSHENSRPNDPSANSMGEALRRIVRVPVAARSVRSEWGVRLDIVVWCRFVL